VLRGGYVLPAVVVRELLRRAARWDEDVRLTERELAWLRDLAQGLTVAQVAARSGYSERMIFRFSGISTRG
jgi:DNA-binding NarL/FixJ family response regulator